MSSSEQTAVRGFVPPRSDDERRLMRRVEELCTLAQSRGIPKYSGFFSDREQDLARAAMNRAGCTFGRFEGGTPSAERRVLCLEPPTAWQACPVVPIRITAAVQGGTPPLHRDCLGALLGLGLERACIGDILPDPAAPGRWYALILADKLDFITAELSAVGRCPARAESCDALPAALQAEPPRELREATVPSLRADTVLAAMLRQPRSAAAELICAGRVEINHVELCAAHETVYAQDIFTVRGTGRFRLENIGGKSRKDRIFISFFEY